MQINWKVRFRNPVFVAQLVCAVVMPLITGMGYEWSQMTTWDTLGEVIAAALGNPVVVVAMVVSVFNLITDPTTSGISDSKSALERTELKGNYKKEA